MKVLMINVVCGVKSTGKICTDIADELTKQGHDVKIAYGREIVPEEYSNYAIRIGTDLDVKVHAGLARISDSAGFHSKYYTRRFIKWVKKYDPDVIQLHNIHGYYINVEILFDYLRTCGKRVIWTLHDCWAFTGHSALCDGDGCTKWKTGCGKCPQKGVYPKSIVDRSAVNWKRKRELFVCIPNLTIVTPSHWMEKNVKESYLKNYSVTVINNGIDISVFKQSDGNGFRVKHNLKNKLIILGVATVWGYKKGFDDFVKLSTMLDENYKVVLVGVEKRLQTADYPNLLTFGMTNSISELVDIYSSADIFVNLTYCDTFPTVNLEARACGLPIITYDTGGSPEAAGGNVFAVVRRGDIRGIAGCVQKFKKEYNYDTQTTIDYEMLSNQKSIRAYVEMLTKREKMQNNDGKEVDSHLYLSICIPAYNRPKELGRLLRSIDSKYEDEIEIVISEDMSPERDKIKNVVEDYKSSSPYTVHYYENDENYGYDKNIRLTAKKAQGKWVMYMGNDDAYIKGSLDKYIEWMKGHDNLGYILRRYRAVRPDKSKEEHRYARQDVFFQPGESTIVELYRRSLFISGFTFRKDCFDDYDCSDFDGMLMFQLYILSVICKDNPSAYCDIPITKWMVGGVPDFGKSKAEEKLYESGSNTLQNSINFLAQVGAQAEITDQKLGTNIKSGVMKSYSKYSFGYLYEHRDDGVRVYKDYAKEIKKLGLGDSAYFYIYYYALLILGTKNCQKGIRLLKKAIGKTPRL